MPRDETTPLPKPSNEADAYDVRERIAVGTGAIVYRAVEISSDTEVLFKVLQPEEMAHPLNVNTVLERRADLARIRHPNVAQLLDVFEDDEGCVLVYNYMAGKGGHLCPKDSELTQAEARMVARQLCDALQTGEDANFPHGEIKPSNLIIARNGVSGPVVQLQDWGLGECRVGEPPEESLLFMAPERLKGGAPTFQSDLFSVGATLVFLLTGHVAVQGGSREELLAAWKSFDISSLPPLRPDLEASFVQWIGWLMRAKAGDRPDSVEKAAEVLSKVIAYGEALDKRSAKAAAAAFANAQAAASAAPAKDQAARVHLPGAAPTPAQRARPQQKTAAPAAQKTPETATPPPPVTNREPAASHVFRWIFVVFAVGSIGTASMLIYEERESLKVRWSEWSAAQTTSEKPAAIPAPKPAPEPAPPMPAVAAKAASPAPLPQKLDPPLAAEKFQYGAETDLNGASGGTGWASPWKANLAKIKMNPKTKAMSAGMGGGESASLTRSLGESDKLAGSGLFTSVRLWHVGPAGPAVLFDLLEDSGGKNAAPVIISPAGNQLKITIQGGTGEIKAPAGKELRIVFGYSFKPTKDGNYDVQMSVVANPNPKNADPSAGLPKCSLSRKDVKLPATLSVSIKSKGKAQQGFSINELKIGRSLKEAIQ